MVEFDEPLVLDATIYQLHYKNQVQLKHFHIILHAKLEFLEQVTHILVSLIS